MKLRSKTVDWFTGASVHWPPSQVARVSRAALVSGALFSGLSAVMAWATLAITSPAPAEAKAYGPAGCGLGSLIFDADSGFTQIFAATTNGTLGNQTFGITSGTSNCADSSGGTASAKAFVETNRVALAKDIARGRGETIDSLTVLAGCRQSSAVGSSLQRRFDQIFSDVAASDSAVGDSVIAALRADSSLACSALDAG